jgi:hypothetical protein
MCTCQQLRSTLHCWRMLHEEVRIGHCGCDCLERALTECHRSVTNGCEGKARSSTMSMRMRFFGDHNIRSRHWPAPGKLVNKGRAGELKTETPSIDPTSHETWQIWQIALLISSSGFLTNNITAHCTEPTTGRVLRPGVELDLGRSD